MYMAKREMIQEYENIILGNQKSYSYYYFTDNQKINQDIALEAFRYAFEKILHYDPETLRERISIDLLKKMKLYSLYTRFIVFPSELAKQKDVWYLCNLLYPHKYPNGLKENTIQMYTNLMNGYIKKFPKHVFDGNEGKIKACICLQYAINHYLSFNSVDELYDFFSQEHIIQFLHRVKLDAICSVNYTYPIDFLHDSLPMVQRNEVLYKYARSKVKNNVIQKIIAANNTEVTKKVLENLNVIMDKKTSEQEKDNCERVLFSALRSEINAHICLNHLINTVLSKKKIEDLYDFFSEPEKIDKFLLKYRLKKVCKRYFETPVDFLHQTLSEDKRDILSFNYAKKKYKKKVGDNNA